MTPRKPHLSLAATLQAAAAAYQDAHVIHRCVSCKQPCCKLETLVLELDWKQVKALWQLEESRTAFDRRLAADQGPEEIRAGNGLYYAHRKPCPAYDLQAQTCRVYDQPIKPVGCSDFPVYGDEDCIVADLRCEAVDIEVLKAWVAEAFGPGYRITQSANPDFPFLITLSLKKLGHKPRR